MFESFNDQNSEVLQEERPEGLDEIEAERANILSRFLTHRITDNLGNLLPVINVAKLGIESAVGKTTSGAKLSGKERLVYVLESAALLMVCITIAKQVQGTADPEMWGAAVASKVVAYTSHFYVNKDAVMSTIQNFAQSHPSKEMFESVVSGIANLPDAMFSNRIVELNLNS